MWWMIPAGFILLALGGMSFFLTSFKMVPLLPPQRQGLAAAGRTLTQAMLPVCQLQ